MIPIIMSSLIVAALLAGEPPALPGRCGLPPGPTPAQVHDESDAVFVGRVIGQRDSVRSIRQEPTNHTFVWHDTEHTMVIDAAWKLPAAISDTVRVWTTRGPETPVMKVGESWMVYATDTQYFPGRLYAPRCGRTRRADQAGYDFAALGAPTSGALPTRALRPDQSTSMTAHQPQRIAP